VQYTNLGIGVQHGLERAQNVASLL
jgi:hypothetical protein